MSAAVRTALGKTKAVTVFGTEYETEDGTPVRDFVHPTDVADAFVRASAHVLSGGPSGILNVGSGTGHSVKEVIAAVARASGRDVPTEDGPMRPGDAPEVIADIDLIKEILGWEPKMSDLDNIAGSAWQRQAAECVH